MSIKCLLVLSKRQLKKDKIADQRTYMASPLDGRDIVKFLVNKNYIG